MLLILKNIFDPIIQGQVLDPSKKIPYDFEQDYRLLSGLSVPQTRYTPPPLLVDNENVKYFYICH